MAHSEPLKEGVSPLPFILCNVESASYTQKKTRGMRNYQHVPALHVHIYYIGPNELKLKLCTNCYFAYACGGSHCIFLCAHPTRACMMDMKCSKKCIFQNVLRVCGYTKRHRELMGKGGYSLSSYRRKKIMSRQCGVLPRISL
ncbi:hypothetical protein POVWA2_017010 [Plasmodium ovale wallikeri]|uniref:Uncharacterized protein n=1 Tax=Plasmodium ovale wallikeri TaxID=864142 RepID=A0A1A8YQP5_PLAOA|nr:hypothetical protein POVWA1_017130 [Plasmodium ovale wallikeri]SBT33883.1 hypothetical protein POVWA2_017010 [Plasmodium ovale wallikeri]